MISITPEEFSNMLPVSDEIEQAVFSHGVLTGSACFFSEEMASDIDYIMPPHCLELLEDLTSFKDMQNLQYGDPRHTFPVYVKLKNITKPVNLIFTASEYAFAAWVDTTLVISYIVAHYPNFKHALEIRENRVDLFAVLRKMLLPKEDEKKESFEEEILQSIQET